MIFSSRNITNLPPILIKDGMSYTPIRIVESTKFLGIHYDQQLNFKHHINYLKGKLSKLAGMFHSLKTYIPTHIMKMIYHAQVNSILNYNTPIWCCNYETNTKPLYLLQKRIIRSVSKSDFLAHSNPLFKKLDLIKLSDINKLYMGAQYFKHPEKYIRPQLHQHERNTRLIQNRSLRTPRHFLSKVAKSFLIQGPKNYNSIPQNIKNAKSLTSFKNQFKKHLVSTY